MPSSHRRIVRPTVVFHPTCCSNALTRAPKAATSSIRSITSRVKSRRCSTRHAGPATGSTRAVKGDAGRQSPGTRPLPPMRHQGARNKMRPNIMHGRFVTFRSSKSTTRVRWQGRPKCERRRGRTAIAHRRPLPGHQPSFASGVSPAFERLKLAGSLKG